MTPEEAGGASLEMLAYRVAALESGLKEFSQRVDRQYEQLQAAITALSFVRLDVYLSEREAMTKDIDSSRKLAMATFGMLASAIIGAIIIAVSTVL